MKISALLEAKGKTAVVGWGRGMGHKGHMLLAKAVIHQAQQMNATPIFILSKTSLIDPSTGELWTDVKKVRATKDDPLSPQEKLSIYQKTFPDNAKIFTVADENAGTINDALEKLSLQGFTDIILVVGADQKSAFQYLVNPSKDGSIPYQKMGLNSLKVMSRQETGAPGSDIEGPRATPMREVLLKPDDYRKKHPEFAKLSDEQMQYAVWRDGMPDSLDAKEVLDLMNKAKDRLGRAEKIAPPRVSNLKEFYSQIKPILENVSVEKKAKTLKKMMEIAFVKLNKQQHKLDEFAPDNNGGGDEEPDEYEILHKLAAMWWNGTEQQMIKAQKTLESMGWEIGEDEGYDNGGVFVVRAGDIHGKSYISWPHEDLQLYEAKSKVIAKTAKDLTNPPKIMQHRAKRDQEREEQYKNAQLKRTDENKDYLDEK